MRDSTIQCLCTQEWACQWQWAGTEEGVYSTEEQRRICFEQREDIVCVKNKPLGYYLKSKKCLLDLVIGNHWEFQKELFQLTYETRNQDNKWGVSKS